ncbi:MAG: amidohydrolase [Actinomycetia bacterium]|nr:amidohydrolase [Actinomycetes bacterium]
MTRFRWFLAVAACLVLVPSAGSAGTRARGVIVFAANRKPALSGEIYRIGLNGKRVDLSRSSAFDSSPALATDGRSVAFLSTRGGHVAIYVVGLNGRNAKRVSPLLARVVDNQTPSAAISWAPDSKHFSALIFGTGSGLYVAAPGRSWRAVPGTHDALNQGAEWSPDGRVLAFTVAQAGEVRVIDAAGRTKWTVPGESATWSARGKLAVQANSYTLAVYDETGHALGSFSAGAGAWSPNGDRLASLTPSRRTLEIRAGVTGRPTLRHAVPDVERLGWLGAGKLRLYGQTGWIGFDVARARTVRLPGAYAPFGSVPYVDGTRAIAELFGRNRNSLAVTDIAGRTHVLATALPCPEANAFSNLQFISGGRFVIYATACPVPPSDIYSIAPDGSGLRRLTTSVHDDTQPAVSPNGQTIAYTEVDNAVKCSGCPNTLWLMNADGTSAHALPNAPDAAGTPYDDYPSFSPDGSQLLFVRGGPNGQRLFSAPVAGGAARDVGIAGSFPSWGPQRIAFDDGRRVVTAAPDGKDRRPAMLSGRAVQGAPAWSADGRPRCSRLRRAVGRDRHHRRRRRRAAYLAPRPARPVPFRTTGVVAGREEDRVHRGRPRGYRGRVDDRRRRSRPARVTHDLGALSSVGWR